MEKRTQEIRLTEMRAVQNDENRMKIEGYAVVFDSPSHPIYGEWIEYVDRNAFNGCDMKDVVLRYNHKDSYPIMARTKNNSLQLNIDDKGLKIEAELIDTASKRDLYKSIQEGLVDKMSFRFSVSKNDWDYSTTPTTRRILGFDKIFDVSVVDEPAYEATEVYARSKEEVQEEKRKYEEQRLEFEKEKLKLKLSI